ncbi:MAG: hypothetical protein P3B98_02085 [Gemmatimonadota bacterium]|nr:hypothetical protein [Gemmatimonadota bacterium]
MKRSKQGHHEVTSGKAHAVHPVYRVVLPQMVAKATRELGLPALPRQIRALNAAAITGLPATFDRLFSHYLPKFAEAGLIRRWKLEGRRTSFYAPKNWHGALPPKLPYSMAAQFLEAARQFHRDNPATPFTSRDITARLASDVRGAGFVASGIGALATQGRLVRVGKTGCDRLYFEPRAYRALSTRARSRVVRNYATALLAGHVTTTLAAAVASLVRALEQQRFASALPSDLAALRGRPFEKAEILAAVNTSISPSALNAGNLSAAIGSATSTFRTTSDVSLRCVGSIGTRHFYAFSKASHSPYVDLRIAEYQLSRLLESAELRILRGIAGTGISDSGVRVPAVVAAARFAEFAARVQWRREVLGQMDARSLLTSNEAEQHRALIASAGDVEHELAAAVRASGGDGIQLTCDVPDIPDDGAVVPTLTVEAAAVTAGLPRGKSQRELSGRLARRLGAVERTVPSRVALAPETRRKGGRARVYLRRSRVLCYLLRKAGGPNWVAIGAYAEEVLGDLSEADVFAWLLMNGNEHDAMVAAACLAILDSMGAREALARFLEAERRQTRRASAAMEFAVIGLARKPLLPRATGLELVHRDLVRVLSRDSDRRIARLALWTLRSWEQEVGERELLTL